MSYLSVGSIIDPSRDPNPSSGPHLDVRIIPLYGENKGQRVDPSTKQHILDRIYVGEGDNRRGLSSYTLTSGYGPRDTGIPGASKFHKGHDYGIDIGQQISVLDGEGFFSQNGVGVASIKDADGNPYEIEFYHTDPAGSTMDPTPMPGGGTPTSGDRSGAKAKAKAYSDMSKSEMNAAYDAMRSDPAKAEVEGMKMHNAYFGKPKSFLG